MTTKPSTRAPRPALDPTRRRRARLVVALVVVALSTAGCIPNRVAGRRCTTTDWGEGGGWVMRCEVHRAVAFEGDVVVDDPDGIVVEATFAAASACDDFLALCAPWAREPLADWIEQRWGPDEPRVYRYDVFGTSRDDLRVVRA